MVLPTQLASAGSATGVGDVISGPEFAEGFISGPELAEGCEIFIVLLSPLALAGSATGRYSALFNSLVVIPIF